MKYHYSLLLLSIHCITHSIFEPFNNNFDDAGTICLDKIYIDMGITSVTYQLNKTNIFIGSRAHGFSLQELISKPSTIHNLSSDNKIIFNPNDTLFPLITLTFDNKLSQSITLKGSLPLKTAGIQSFQAIFYTNILAAFLQTQKNFSMQTIIGGRRTITYNRHAIRVVLDLTFDFSGGHFTAAHIYVNAAHKYDPVLSIDEKTLKSNGITLEIY